MEERKKQKVDFLVLGSGIAGLRAAVELASAGSVLVLSKGNLFESNTQYAQGGIAAAVGEDDEVGLHLQDTLRAGDGLCREDAVRVLVEEGPERIQQLIEWGMRFDRDGTKLAFTREGGHGRSRVLHAHGDSTGSEIVRALFAKVKSLPSIKIQPCAFAVDFVTEGTAVCGVDYLDEGTSTAHKILADAVLVATGGLGQVYKETTNPSLACGDGVAMAYRAGALISDMEFVQFHPTALYVKGAPRFLLTEALRGEGAYLRNVMLERFMPRYHEGAELAPRDVVSRAIVTEMHRCRSECVYLDLTALDEEKTKRRFPTIYATCLKYNIDVTTDLVPVRPAAHYAIGGVLTDLEGVTSLKGLYAAGEAAATGVHGANRLASNSLLEGLVFGARAAAAMIARRPPRIVPHSQPAPVAPDGAASPAPSPANSSADDPADADKIIHEARCKLWEKVGIIRNGKELCEAVKRLEALPLPAESTGNGLARKQLEARNILQVARLIARSALARQESRGTHYRSDFPLKNTTPPKHSIVAKGAGVRFE